MPRIVLDNGTSVQAPTAPRVNPAAVGPTVPGGGVLRKATNQGSIVPGSGVVKASAGGPLPFGSVVQKPTYAPAGGGAPTAPTNAVQALLSPSGSGGGGAGGGAVSPAAAQPQSLQDYINSNFLYQQQQGQNDEALNNFDADTLAQTQETQAQQAVKQQQLQQNQNQLGQANADSLAARGLLDSGVNFQNQDRIDAAGNQQRSAIDSLLTNLVSGRQQGRLTQQQANRTALDSVMNQLAQQYAGSQAAGV